MLFLPEWLDAQDWNDYIEMRKAIKKPMTERAKEIAIRKLARLKAEGEDVKAVLEQSIFNDWQGLFAVKETSPNGRSHKSYEDERDEENKRVIAEAADRYRQRMGGTARPKN